MAKRRSITKTHERINQLDWDSTYHEPVKKWPSKYTFPKNAKDPMKQIMREYLPMELEKDDRVFGGMDTAVRGNMVGQTHHRWAEILKPFIVVTNFAEVAAGRCMSMLMNTVPNNELRNGYHVQFVDELRHTGMQMSLHRWYMKNSVDPAGWDIGQKAFGRDPITLGAMNYLSHFIVGDPIQCAITLQVVAETAFTNVAFVALPDLSARNGDYVLPTTYLSVQSDEARHISNGYATMLTVLQDENNVPHLERDLQQAWWISHAFLDPFTGGIMEYFTKDRSDPESFINKWDRWIYDDWYRNYVVNMEKVGLTVPPDIFVAARKRLEKGLVHKLAMFAMSTWPMHFWRMDPLTESDFEWFENHYPGWYNEYGDFWEAYAQLSDPSEGALIAQAFGDQPPPFCRTCQMPCLFDEDTRIATRPLNGNAATARSQRDGMEFLYYCSDQCKWLDDSNPGRYIGERSYLDRYHGMGIADVVRDMEFVRPDGISPIGQPHLDMDRMWSLADLERTGYEIVSGNIATTENLTDAEIAQGRLLSV